jgi:putative DNA primase/helicase
MKRSDTPCRLPVNATNGAAVAGSVETQGGAAIHSPGVLLLPQHRKDLKASGLTDETIKACGFFSLIAPSKVHRVLGWQKYDGKLGSCLAIPFWDAAGQPLEYLRLKPDKPRKDREGKVVKYESPKGMPNIPYFPPGCIGALADPMKALVITEGEKKAAAATQRH